jgi:hypothetical protein
MNWPKKSGKCFSNNSDIIYYIQYDVMDRVHLAGRVCLGYICLYEPKIRPIMSKRGYGASSR